MVALCPPGIPVGIVAAVGEAGIEVEPFVDPARLEVVQVLDYGLDGIIEFKAGSRQQSEIGEGR